MIVTLGSLQLFSLRPHAVDVDGTPAVRGDEEVLVSVAVNVGAGHSADGDGGTKVCDDDQVVVPVGRRLRLRLQVVGATVVTARHKDPRLDLLAVQCLKSICVFLFLFFVFF